jgi:ABC-2 type transport system permease protein
MSFFRRIKPIIKKEFRQIFRDPRTLVLLVFMPTFLLILFGYALNFDVKHISLAVYDEDKSSLSREFIRNFLNSEYFDQKYYLHDYRQITEYLDEGRFAVALVIPYDFSEKILRGQESQVSSWLTGPTRTRRRPWSATQPPLPRAIP